jgi:hypothetical protein
VAAWLSETVLRGRGPGVSEFESHQRGRIFSKQRTSAGPWMCVYVFQGLTVGWWKEERHSSDHHREVGWVQIPATHGCRVVFVLCRPERRGEGGRGWPGKVPRTPAAPPKEKKRGEKEEKTISRPQGT